MNKRIYVAEIQEFWKINSVSHSKLHFKVLFDKSEILEYSFGYAKFCQEHNKTVVGNGKLSEGYDIEITIYEYAYERYQFDFLDGLVSYFNKVIKSSENIYDNILKCIDCNVFKYDMNGNLIDTHVRTSSCIYNISFWDMPLLEDACNGKYTGEFKYYMSKKPDHNLSLKRSTYGLRFVYIKVDHEPFDNEDSGLTEYLYIIDYNIEDMLRFARKEILSLAESYIDDFEFEDIEEDDLIETAKTKFNNLLVEVYNVDNDMCNKVFSTTNISDLF